MTTSITAGGSYPAGDYRLAAPVISVNGGDGITFTGDATLDMNGCTVINTVPMDNSLICGIQGQGKLTIYNTYPQPGKIQNFRYGIKALGANSVISGVDVSLCWAMGIWIVGSDSVVQDNIISSIGGATDADVGAYAIAIQCNGNRTVVRRNTGKELYRQAAAAPGVVGEGLLINFPADVTGCYAADNVLDNALVRDHTYFGFSGANGANVYERNRARNVWRFLGMAGFAGSAARNNISVLESALVGSAGIGNIDPASCDGNIMIGYETPYGQAIGRNIAMSFPGFPVAPPPSYVTVLDAPFSGASSFGNVTGDTVRCSVAAAALSNIPAGALSHLRLTLQGHPSEPITYDKMFVGLGSGVPSATGMTQLKLGSATSWVVPAGGQVVVEAAFAYDKTSALVFSSSHSGGVNSDRMAALLAFANATTYLKNGDEASAGGVSGYAGYAGYLSGVTKIELA